ncbi:MAG: FAD-binding protein [Pseudomonadales bacterium]|nr:FAD-binding protein [Pseudomonadales bacterium]
MIASLLDKLRFREVYTESTICIEDSDAMQWNREADLVVVGFGGAGAAAALEASEQGLDTLVLDRLSGGGATTISGGIYYAGGGTEIQQQADVEDSSENMFNYLKQEVKGAVSDATLKKFCDDSVSNFDWIVQHGVKFDASPCPFKASFPPDQYYLYFSGNESFAPYNESASPAMRGHRGHKKSFSGPAIFEPLRAAVLAKKNISVQTQSKVVALITDQHGSVIGVKALQLGSGWWSKTLHKIFDRSAYALRNLVLFFPSLFNLFAAWTEYLETSFGQAIYIRANKGVVLATGGFFNNQTMVKQYAPKYIGGSPLGTFTDDGSGISLAMQLGAATSDMHSVAAWRFINPPTSFVKGMLVGPSGERICNEMLYGAQLGEQISEQHDGIGWVIIDDATYQASKKDLTLDKAQWFHVMVGYFFLWFGRKRANTIEALAAELNIDAKSLLASMQSYNQIAASDAPDPMGKPKDFMPVIGDGPYHAINVCYDFFFAPCPSLTFGGLQVDEETGLVLNQEGQAIAGLYAAGRSAAGIPSRGYVSGLSIADCVFSGRRAAQHAGR